MFSSLTARRIPMKANSMADVRICVNMMTETTESSNFTVLRYKEMLNITVQVVSLHLKQ